MFYKKLSVKLAHKMRLGLTSMKTMQNILKKKEEEEKKKTYFSIVALEQGSLECQKPKIATMFVAHFRMVNCVEYATGCCTFQKIYYGSRLVSYTT